MQWVGISLSSCFDAIQRYSVVIPVASAIWFTLITWSESIGGGIWHADSQPLSLLRRAISTKPSELKQVLCSPGIAKDFLGMSNDFNEHQVVNAFIEKNSEDALKTAPKVCAVLRYSLPFFPISCNIRIQYQICFTHVQPFTKLDEC